MVTFTLDDNNYVKYECSNGQSLSTNLQDFEHVDGRKLGNEVSEITILNNSYMYRWNPGESLKGDINMDVSLHKPLSERIKKLFYSDVERTSREIWLANVTMYANRLR